MRDRFASTSGIDDASGLRSSKGTAGTAKAGGEATEIGDRDRGVGCAVEKHGLDPLWLSKALQSLSGI